MVNVFVHHAHDGIGRCLASVIRECDGLNRQFDYLAVETADSYRRMQQFLSQQGLNLHDVSLPFIVLVDDSAQRRSVLHGPVLQEWLGNLVAAYVRSPGMTPASVRERILAPHLPPYVLHLLSFANTIDPHDGPQQPPQQPPPQPQPQDPVGQPDECGDDDDGDTGEVTVYATVPTKAGKRPGGAVSSGVTAVMLDAGKARERMVMNARRQ